MGVVLTGALLLETLDHYIGTDMEVGVNYCSPK